MTNTNIETLDLIIQEAKERIHNLANKNKKQKKVAKPKKCLIKFVEKIVTFSTQDKFIMKIYSIIDLIKLIQYYKYYYIYL